MAQPAVAWFEVTGNDGLKLQNFHSRLFGRQVQDAGDGSGYGLVQAAPRGIGGGIGPAQDGGPGAMTFYVEVDNPAEYLASAESLGGKTIVPPTEIPIFGLTFAFSSPIRRVMSWDFRKAPSRRERSRRHKLRSRRLYEAVFGRLMGTVTGQPALEHAVLRIEPLRQVIRTNPWR